MTAPPQLASGERPPTPPISVEHAARLARETFGLDGPIQELPSYADRNFLVGRPGSRAVLKVSNPSERLETLDLQHCALESLAHLEVAPRVLPSRAGRELETIELDGTAHFARAVTFLEGTLWSGTTNLGERTWRSLGAMLAKIDLAFAGLDHPSLRQGAQLQHRWDLAAAPWIIGHARRFRADRRELLEHIQREYLGHVAARMDELPRQLIHGDANDHNVVVADGPKQLEPGSGGLPVTGIFDFGDLAHTPRIFELAIAGAYAALGTEHPLARVAAMVDAYHRIHPLTDPELAALFPALCMRLAVSVTAAAIDSEAAPDNEYINVTAGPAWDALASLSRTTAAEAEQLWQRACERPAEGEDRQLDREAILAARRRHVGSALSLSYSQPLLIERGRDTFLFDERGRSYLDCVNNVCHVGHCHPRVVAAATEQIARLNTNTRYLHPNLTRYAERLAALLPDPLSVCFFVNSGSEANELALRLARAATGRRDMIVLEGGYHGHTSSLIDLSNYKHAGPGGEGPPPWVHTAPCPDGYRGRHGQSDAAGQPGQLTAAYLADLEATLTACEPAAFLAEPLIGCGGQIVPPPGWLAGAFDAARAHGAVSIADEVQIGFGRVGSHWWAFEQQGAQPDIVTLGKPIGNGHPMGAVVTTPEIAAAFDNGMEFFSTFGGNPVSCAVGLAVLDVIEDEQLRQRAERVGARLLAGFRELAERFEVLGDVRGTGLYLGVEFVSDRAARHPDPNTLDRVLDRCRDAGILLSSDGPDHNVLKVKPPIAFGDSEAELLLEVFEAALTAETATPR